MRSVVYESSVLFINTAKSLIWLLRMNKIKSKYNALAQCKPESLSLSTALLAIYKTLAVILYLNEQTLKKNGYFTYIYNNPSLYN